MENKEIRITVIRTRVCSKIESFATTDVDLPSYATIQDSFELFASSPLDLKAHLDQAVRLKRLLATHSDTQEIAAVGSPENSEHVDLTPIKTVYGPEKTDAAIEILSEAFPDISFIADRDSADKTHVWIPWAVWVNVRSVSTFELVRTDSTLGNEYVDPETTQVYGEVIERRITFSDRDLTEAEMDAVEEELRKMGFPRVLENAVSLSENDDPMKINSVKDRIGERKEYFDKKWTERLVASLNAIDSETVFLQSEEPQQFRLSLTEAEKPGLIARLFGEKEKKARLKFS